jgi:puromycin-sensitive aminopeptidase
MKLYLTRHKYANTFTEDLWAALSEASKKPVGSIMSGWTKQMGFPVIRVSAEPAGGEPTKQLLKLSRQRFLADGSIDTANTIWMVPIEIATKSSPEKCIHSYLLDVAQVEIVLGNTQPGEWLKVYF